MHPKEISPSGFLLPGSQIGRLIPKFHRTRAGLAGCANQSEAFLPPRDLRCRLIGFHPAPGLNFQVRLESNGGPRQTERQSDRRGQDVRARSGDLICLVSQPGQIEELFDCISVLRR